LTIGWWTNTNRQAPSVLQERPAAVIGTAGLTFVLSAGAAILALYGGGTLQAWEAAFVLSAVSALWLVVAVYFLGDTQCTLHPRDDVRLSAARRYGSCALSTSSSS
jgi:hypothetical protein